MFKFHTDKERYFNIQYSVTRQFIIPFLTNHLDLNTKLQVLEIGCGEGGVLKAFAETGHQCTGIDCNKGRLELARKFIKEECPEEFVQFIFEDFINIDVTKDFEHRYDLIIVKDVIEHIREQEIFVEKLKFFLKQGGKIFFAFPPWQMPFGGHQQICSNRFLSLPYIHLLPIYKSLLVLFREQPYKILELGKLKETGISIERFEKVIEMAGFIINTRRFYLFNPIYKYKFGITPKKQLSFISSIPVLRNYFTTCAYYLIE